MIDVKDLMVGNWVYDYVLEKPIQLNNLSWAIDMGHRGGIDVTEELLERIGFKKDSCGDFYTFWTYWGEDYKYKLEVSDDCNSNRKWSLHVDNDVCNTIGSGEFDYVHELQNLVRVITGRELTITKEMLYG
jgi:hypothetical protein